VGRVLSLVILLLAMCFGALMAYYNQDAVQFRYLAGERQLPLFLLLFFSFLIGAILTLLMMAMRMFGLSAQIRQLRRQLRDTETELKNLRNLPLKDV